MDNLLKINPGLMIWTIITFLAVVIVLWKFVWGAILKGLDERADKIEGDLARAETAKQEAERILADYSAQMAKAREEAVQMMQKNREEAENLKKKIIQSAEKKAEDIKAQAKADIDQAQKAALKELRAYVGDLVVTVTQKVLSTSMDTRSQGDLIQRAMDDFEKNSLEGSRH